MGAYVNDDGFNIDDMFTDFDTDFKMDEVFETNETIDEDINTSEKCHYDSEPCGLGSKYSIW